MKLSTSYNHTLTTGYEFTFDLWNKVKTIQSLNGIYITDLNYMSVSKIGVVQEEDNIYLESWYNLLGDTNYLFPAGTIKPRIILADEDFNQYPSIEFPSDSEIPFLFSIKKEVGTVVLVYQSSSYESYLLYSPKVIALSSNNFLYYDSFPNNGNQLWGNELRDDSNVYNSNSRINGKNVLPTTIVPLNTTRILTIRDIQGSGKSLNLEGIGGRIGILGGTNTPTNNYNFKGKLAAILTFESSLDLNKIVEIETELAKLYINYTGAILLENKIFKIIVGSFFSYDLTTLFIDEWFNIESYILISPLNLGLSITNGIISGITNSAYKGKLIIDVINSNNNVNRFEFEFETCKRDPILLDLPHTNDISLILSTSKDLDGNYYGLYSKNDLIGRWEDARRILSGNILVDSEDTIHAFSQEDLTLKPVHIENDSIFNNNDSIYFSNESKLEGSSIVSRTIIWVYIQKEYGIRKLLNTFPDIKGNGELWTVNNNQELHGNTVITRLDTSINKGKVNTLNYKLPLNKLSFIVATLDVVDNQANNTISFNGLESLRGNIVNLITWNRLLTSSEINTVIKYLAQRYIDNIVPVQLIFNDLYFTTSHIQVDLYTLVSDYSSELQYNLIFSNIICSSNVQAYSIAVNSQGILSFNCNIDDYITLSFTATNSVNNSIVVSIKIKIVLKTNTLYISLRNILEDFSNILIPDNSVITVDTLDVNKIISIKEYRLELINFLSNNLILKSLNTLYNNKQFIRLSNNGSSYLNSSTNINIKTLYIVFIKLDNNKFAYLGNNSNTYFVSDGTHIVDILTSSQEFIDSTKYLNGVEISNSYTIINNILNIFSFSINTSLMYQTISKNSSNNNESFRGLLGLICTTNYEVSKENHITLHSLIRNYFDPSKIVTLLHFNNTLVDMSTRSKFINSDIVYSSLNSKFGSHSGYLIENGISKYLDIENNSDFCFLYEDFTIAFSLYLESIQSWNNNSLTYTLLSLPIDNNRLLYLYINNQTIYIGENLNNLLALYKYNLELLQSFSSNFVHFQIVRYNTNLILFIEGNKIFTLENYVREYRDVNTPIRIGSRNKILDTSINVYIDELLIYRRLALNTDNFNVPTTEYLV